MISFLIQFLLIFFHSMALQFYHLPVRISWCILLNLIFDTTTKRKDIKFQKLTIFCWKLLKAINIQIKYFSGKVVKICNSSPYKFIFNVSLLQILQVFYSENFQKKMTIKYGSQCWLTKYLKYTDISASLFAFLDICSLKLYLVKLFVNKLY